MPSTRRSGSLPPQPVALHGRVVAIFERDGRRWMKVAIGPHYLVEVVPGNTSELALGDMVQLDARVEVSDVRQTVDPNSGGRRNPS